MKSQSTYKISALHNMMHYVCFSYSFSMGISFEQNEKEAEWDCKQGDDIFSIFEYSKQAFH